MKVFGIFIIISIFVSSEIIPQNLSSTQIDSRLNKINGDATEYIMKKILKKNAWRIIEGEVGTNGIDGLFVKYDINNHIKQVMIAEAKYGSSNLGKNKYGTSEKNIRQLSKKGLLYQVDNLIKKYPNDAKYKKIKQHIKTGNYTTRLFKVKADNNILSFEVKKILSNGDLNIIKETLVGNENYKVNGLRINFNNPRTKFEEKLIKYYQQGIYSSISRQFDFSSLESKTLSIQKKQLSQGDIERVIGLRKAINNAVEREYRSSINKFKAYYPNSIKFKNKIHKSWMKKYWKGLKRGLK